MPFSVPFAEATMQRALELARRGLGKVEPNPAVGAVIVDDSGATLGEGWHRSFGGPHAEVDALAVCGTAARGATLFVTLEPCCHFGKTPPCSQAVIAAGIRRVFVATRDPSPLVDGGGIKELHEAGLEVTVGLLEREAQRLIAPFIELTIRHKPWIHAKWAMTLDGKIATRTRRSQWITNELSRATVHRLRGRMDGILIGIGTALSDNPMLNARPAGDRIATRIIVDSSAKLPLNSRLVQTVAETPVVVITTPDAPTDHCQALRAAGVDLVAIAADSHGHPDVVLIAKELGKRRMTNVLVEGGSQLLGSFFDARLINEVHSFIAPKLVGGDTALTPIGGVGFDSIPTSISLEDPVTEFLGGDIYIHGPLIPHRD